MSKSTKINKVLAALLAFVMLFSSTPIHVLAANTNINGDADNYHVSVDAVDGDIVESRIVIDQDDMELVVGDTYQLTYDISAEDQGVFSGTWFETAFVIWEGDNAGGYNAQVRLSPDHNAYYWRDGSVINETDPDWDMANGWVDVDTELIRLIDPVRGLWRVDVQGLPRGTYEIRVINSDDVIVGVFCGLETESFSRLGAAFVPSDELIGNSAQTNLAPYGATGGYLSDGRVDPNAIVMYVSHNNWADFTVANLASNSTFRAGRPLVIRFLGQVGDFIYPGVGNASQAGAVLPPSVAAGNRMMTLAPNNASHQITFEGVGTDAEIFGWGLFTAGGSNIVIRNLGFSNFFQQGVRASQNTTNFWVHHNTFYYGQNRFFFNDEPTDRTMGQGSLDIEQNVRGYTIAYNHFNGGRGTHLIVGGVQNVALSNNVHRHYGTLHHNIYDNAQERNPRTRHHNLHMFNNLFREVLGHPLHYRLADRYTGYGIGSAHNATIWAEGNIFDQVGFPFLRSRHGHARGYYPHTGHNHFFGDGPGFIVTGDNISLTTGQSVGAMTIPVFGADLGYRNTVRGITDAANHADFVSRVGQLQPNVMSPDSYATFDATRDIGITVDQAATNMVPPATDILYPGVGFPAMGAAALTHGWGFEGDFRPSTNPADVMPTGTLAQTATLRAYIEANAGSQQTIMIEIPAAPTGVTTELNSLEYFVHAQASPTPSLRTITYEDTFTLNWQSSGDLWTDHYEIQFQDGGTWRTLGTVPSGPGANSFVTQDMNDFGYMIMENDDFDWIAVHLGGEGYVVMYPHANFGHPDSPHYTEAQVPTVESLRFTAPWVIADVTVGGTYNFRVRAVNTLGASEWATVSHTVAANTPTIQSVVQQDEIDELTAGSVDFTVNTNGIADGTFPITLTVPRSRARNVIPWPAQQNFTHAMVLHGNTATIGAGVAQRTANGGAGTLTVVDGVGTITVQLTNVVPEDIYDLVLTINAGSRIVSLPFALYVGMEQPEINLELGVDSGTWFETAFAIWEGGTTGGYRAYVRLTPDHNAYYWRDGSAINVTDPSWDMANDWVAVDNELIRLIDPVRGFWRVDVQGLPRGTYDIRVINSDNEIVDLFEELETESFSRLGAAFVPSDELIGNSAQTNLAPYGATGGYLSDGRIDPDAIIMYVSHNDWDDFVIANLVMNSTFRGGNPLVVRFLGQVGDFTNPGVGLLSQAGAQLPPAIPANQNNRMMQFAAGTHQLTWEGVGTDAEIFGWGLFTNGAVNFVVRNIGFSNFFQQGLRASGNTTNFWAHHNTFYYGQNRFFFNDEPTDRTMGQGSLDIEQNVRGYTIGYNHFNGGRGTHLIVGSVQNWALSANGHRHYGTLHHNIYDNAQERNPRTRHHNLHMFNNLFREVLGHPLHYRLNDRYTGYGIGAAHNATIWAEGNIFDQVGFPFLRSRHGHARGYYPHTGHNHFFADAPGFIVTGDNISLTTGNSVGRMYVPAFGADLGYRNTVRGITEATNHADFVNRVGQLQPNVMSPDSYATFDATRDVGITVDQAATLMVAPDYDVLAGTANAVGFPALNANANTHGWGFEGDFRPSTNPADVMPTGTLAQTADLRAHIEASAGSQQTIMIEIPAAPTGVTTELNSLEYFVHAQASPTPSLRTITYEDTFTLNWQSSGDLWTDHYEIQFQDGGTWRTLGTVPSGPGANAFVTQDMNDFGYMIMENDDFDWIAVHLGGEGYVVMYPHANFGHPDSPHYAEGQIPTVESLRYTAPWVIADVTAGGTYNFRVRAVNALGTSEWVTVAHTVGANTPTIQSVVQQDEIAYLTAGTVEFTVNTAGIADGTFPITLTVPRSVARNVMPWPAAQNFTHAMVLQGNTATIGNGVAQRTANGGTGTLAIVDGVGTITVTLTNVVPENMYDLVLTINAGNRIVSLPFALHVGELPTEPQISDDLTFITTPTVVWSPINQTVVTVVEDLMPETDICPTAGQTVVWSSSDETVVTVNETGLITAIGEGVATIRVTLVCGGDYDEIEITVSLPETNIEVTVDADGVVTVDVPADYNYTLDNGVIVIEVSTDGDMDIDVDVPTEYWIVTRDPDTRTITIAPPTGYELVEIDDEIIIRPIVIIEDEIEIEVGEDGVVEITLPEGDYEYTVVDGTLVITIPEGSDLLMEFSLPFGWTIINREEESGTITIAPPTGYELVLINGEIIVREIAVRHTVVFDRNDGSENTVIVTLQIVAGTLITDIPAAPTRTGFTFIGWTLNADGDVDFEEDAPVTADMTIFAQWERVRVTYTFDWRVTDVPYVTGTVYYGETPIAPIDVPENLGYEFIGWSPAVGQITTDTTFVANWIPANVDPVYVTFVFNWNVAGFESVTGQVLIGESPIEPTNIPENPGYDFIGWTPVVGPINVNTLFNAIWERIVPPIDETVTITFAVVDDFGGTLVAYVDDVAHAPGTEVVVGSDVEFIATPSYGYRVLEWRINGEIANSLARVGNILVIEDIQANTTVTVAFGEIPVEPVTRTVTVFRNHDANDNTVLSTIDVESGGTVALPGVHRAGYTFVGWFTARTGGEPFTATTTVTADMNVYAQWEAEAVVVPNVTVTFIRNHDATDTTVVTTMDVQVGSALGEILVTPGRTGYRFVGWFTARTGGEPFTVTTTVTTDMNVYAHWQVIQVEDDNEDVEEVTVTFIRNHDANDNTVVATRDVEVGETVTLPPAPTRAGHEFLGWFTARVGGTEFTAATVVTADMNVYARWRPTGGGIVACPPGAPGCPPAPGQPGPGQPTPDNNQPGPGNNQPAPGQPGSSLPQTGVTTTVVPLVAGLAGISAAIGAVVAKKKKSHQD